MMTSGNPKLIFHIQLLFFPTSSPLVIAAADNSSPMIEHDAMSGTILYSTASAAFPAPISTPRIRIASFMDFDSSMTVGKNLKITLTGIVSLSVTCIRFMAARNSDTLVVFTIYLARMAVGSIFVMIYSINARADSKTVSSC